MYLNAYPAVSAKFAEFITAGDVLAKALDKLDGICVPPRRERLRVGQGQPGTERAFRAAHDAAGGLAVLGEATTEVYEDGPGWVQHFAGGHGRGPVVLCARHEHPATVIDAGVWDAICDAGAGSGRLDAVGYPVVAESSPSLIAADVEEVRLDGGSWGSGRLVRQPDRHWRWEAPTRFSFETRERDRWTAGSDKMDLRLRCAARIAWFADELSIDDASRRRLQAALPGGPLLGIIAEVADHLGLAPGATAAATWRRTPDSEGYNDRRFASYRLLVPGPQGGTALGLWARFQLPDRSRSPVVSMVDMRVDFTALGVDHGRALATPVDPTLRLDEQQLQRFFIAGWLTVAQLLPLAATDDPLAPRPAGPTTVELHIDTERAAGFGGQRILGLLDMLDLSGYGVPPSQPRPWMSTAVTAWLGLDGDDVRQLVVRSLAHMASGYGFLVPD